MNIEELEHVIGAACRIADTNDMIVVGSQAIYANNFDEPLPDVIESSSEVDLTPFYYPDRAIDIDAAIGECSNFSKTHEVYGHGIEISDIVLPDGWKDRLIDISFTDRYHGETYTAWCISIPDLCASKLAAGRPKDFILVEWLLKNEHITFEEIKEHINKIPERQKGQAERALDNLKLAERKVLSKRPIYSRDDDRGISR